MSSLEHLADARFGADELLDRDDAAATLFDHPATTASPPWAAGGRAARAWQIEARRPNSAPAQSFAARGTCREQQGCDGMRARRRRAAARRRQPASVNERRHGQRGSPLAPGARCGDTACCSAPTARSAAARCRGRRRGSRRRRRAVRSQRQRAAAASSSASERAHDASVGVADRAPSTTGASTRGRGRRGGGPRRAAVFKRGVAAHASATPTAAAARDAATRTPRAASTAARRGCRRSRRRRRRCRRRGAAAAAAAAAADRGGAGEQHADGRVARRRRRGRRADRRRPDDRAGGSGGGGVERARRAPSAAARRSGGRALAGEECGAARASARGEAFARVEDQHVAEEVGGAGARRSAARSSGCVARSRGSMFGFDRLVERAPGLDDRSRHVLAGAGRA